MDDQYIANQIKRRERGYIWLEKELKKNLLISTAVITVFFIIILNYTKLFMAQRALVLFMALILNAIWHYLLYRREYQNYQFIYQYLEEFEMGNYKYRGNGDSMDTGIRAQLTEQLERLGEAFYILKSRLVDEKENTKSLVTDISHQLKTPAAALKLSYEILRDETLTEEERQEFLERGGQETQRLSQLMESLSNLSRLEADMIRLSPKEASLKDTLIRAVNGIYIKAEEKQIVIEMEAFENIRIVHDVHWTAEAVSNVLDNAVKYSPSGTKVKIRVEIFVSYVFIEVEDEGIGIPKSEYPDIFKRFYRGTTPLVEKEEGAGIGLYLVRKIFEEQGGSVRAYQPHGGGTVMQMMLPKRYTL